MPGSSNFIGEFNILLGVFRANLPVAAIAFLGVTGAAYYALRLFIVSMHNRVGQRWPRARSASPTSPRSRVGTLRLGSDQYDPAVEPKLT